MEILPESLVLRDRYKLLTGTIVPRPIAVVATMSPDGSTNLAPFSFFCGVGSNPMTLAFCPGNKPDGSDKDSLRNSLPPSEGGTGEFVVNVATESWALQMAAAAESLPYGESEFDLAGLTALPSSLVAPPRVAESPVAFECRTLQVIRTNPGVQGGGNLVLGEVVCAHVDDALVNDRWHLDADALRAIGRMGGPEYCRTGDRFSMPRGRAALESGERLTGNGS
jgi:flavin reductase (DIM6/NTAB) family NADH-FMN oxidoreductase RutF